MIKQTMAAMAVLVGTVGVAQAQQATYEYEGNGPVITLNAGHGDVVAPVYDVVDLGSACLIRNEDNHLIAQLPRNCDTVWQDVDNQAHLTVTNVPLDRRISDVDGTYLPPETYSYDGNGPVVVLNAGHGDVVAPVYDVIDLRSSCIIQDENRQLIAQLPVGCDVPWQFVQDQSFLTVTNVSLERNISDVSGSIYNRGLATRVEHGGESQASIDRTNRLINECNTRGQDRARVIINVLNSGISYAHQGHADLSVSQQFDVLSACHKALD